MCKLITDQDTVYLTSNTNYCNQLIQRLIKWWATLFSPACGGGARITEKQVYIDWP